MPEQKSSPEIKLIRLYPFPLKDVWDAFVDPEGAKSWWGPRGFTITTHSKELKEGGVWDYTMHGPEGKDFPNLTKYLEVKKYSKLVYDHGGSKTAPPMFRVTVLFTEAENHQTQMDMTMALPTAEAAENIRKHIKHAGGDTCWDRFAEYLFKKVQHKEVFVINRSFPVPAEIMFKVWTDPSQLSQWLAPTGFIMKFIRPELKTGGKTFYQMTNGKEVTMYGRTHYLEISPKRVVYNQQFCDEKEGISRHPLAPTWPETMHTTVDFVPEGPGQTRVMVTWEVFGHASAEERNTFLNARSSMSQGWTGSFDKLEDYLRNL